MATKVGWTTNDPYAKSMPWRRGTRVVRSLPKRFESKVIRGEPGECWGWRTAHFKQTGYALFNVRSETDGRWRPTTAHRIAYRLYVGEIPPGWVIDHLCRNRGCVNPDHLEAVTRQVNMRRGVAPAALSVKTNLCQRGHELTPENTIVRPNRSGKRECRTCARARDRIRNKTEKRRAHYRAMYRRRKGIVSD